MNDVPPAGPPAPVSAARPHSGVIMKRQAYGIAALLSMAAAVGVAGWTTGQPLAWLTLAHWRVSALEQGLIFLAFLFFTIHCFVRPQGPRRVDRGSWFVVGLVGSSATTLAGLETFALILHHVPF